jgi:hypothetical protein
MMNFKPEEVSFHIEEYQAHLAELRPKDYPILSSKEVSGRMNLCHRRTNPYTKDGKARVSFVMAETDIKSDIHKAVDKLGGFDKAFNRQDRILIKPNYNSDDPPPGSTALDFLSAVIDLLKEGGYSNISVAEGSGRPWVPTKNVFNKTGLSARMSEMDVPLIDLDRSEYADVIIDGDYLPSDHENPFCSRIFHEPETGCGAYPSFRPIQTACRQQYVCLPALCGNGYSGPTGPDYHGRPDLFCQRRSGHRTCGSSRRYYGLGRFHGHRCTGG